MYVRDNYLRKHFYSLVVIHKQFLFKNKRINCVIVFPGTYFITEFLCKIITNDEKQ